MIPHRVRYAVRGRPHHARYAVRGRPHHAWYAVVVDNALCGEHCVVDRTKRGERYTMHASLAGWLAGRLCPARSARYVVGGRLQQARYAVDHAQCVARYSIKPQKRGPRLQSVEVCGRPRSIRLP